MTICTNVGEILILRSLLARESSPFVTGGRVVYRNTTLFLLGSNFLSVLHIFFESSADPFDFIGKVISLCFFHQVIDLISERLILIPVLITSTTLDGFIVVIVYVILNISSQFSNQGHVLSLNLIHTLRVHYAHAAANLISGYSKYAKVVRVHYFCTIALRTSRAVLTRAWASRRVYLHKRRVDLFSKRVITFC